MVVTMYNVETNINRGWELQHSDDRARGVRTIKTSEFKARCLKLMDEVEESGEEVVITKHGRPVSRLVPFREKPNMPFGRNRDRIRILGDIVAPMPNEWFDDPHEGGDDLF